MKRQFVTFIGGPLNLTQQAVEWPMSKFTYRDIDLTGSMSKHQYDVLSLHSTYYGGIVLVAVYTGSES